ncbi:MAG: tetratricopeptide repeat protein [Candidatus Angelobacter sp.]
MRSNRLATSLCAVLLVAFFAGTVLCRSQVEKLRGKEVTLEEVLYMPSGKSVKRLSLGYSSLLADIYWTRAVQYFGDKLNQRSMRYDLLYPLLDITTDLDPHLIVAYEFGSLFLSQPPPDGAGQPEKAVALVEKGIRENPSYWRLYFTLGFIHYLDRRDYKAASEAFFKGSEVPGALPWMKVMAARMAEHGDDRSTAVYLWKAVYDTSIDPQVKETAVQHLTSLRAEADIEQLEERVKIYRERTGALPFRWLDMVRAGLLPGLPQDPNGMEYKLLPDGTVDVQDPSKYRFIDRSHKK